MEEIISEIVKTFRERYKVTDEEWHIFTKGTQEEQDAWTRSNWGKEESR